MKSTVYGIVENVKDTVVDIANDISGRAIKLGRWIYDNPQATVSIITTAGMLLRASRSLVVSHRTYSERKRIDHTYYDPSTGYHWDLKRKLTNNDFQVLSKRKKNGDEVYDILRDLKVI